MKLLVTIISIVVLSCFAFAKYSLQDSRPSGEQNGKGEKATYTASFQDPLTESMKRGAEIYTEYCIQCHLGQGEGVKGTFPPLANSDWLLPEKRKEAIRVVKYGQSGEIKVNGEAYNGIMAELGLYDDEVADVMNYILNNWGNTGDTLVTEEEVKKVEKS